MNKEIIHSSINYVKPGTEADKDLLLIALSSSSANIFVIGCSSVFPFLLSYFVSVLQVHPIIK
jgi:hypothetical protein